MDTQNGFAIRAVNLAKRYGSGEAELVVFDRLNLEVKRGERLAVIGESGAGKSTLLHLIGVWTLRRMVRYTSDRKRSRHWALPNWRTFAIGKSVLSGRFITCCLNSRLGKRNDASADPRRFA